MSDLISRKAVLDHFKNLCDACGEDQKYSGVMCRACYLDDAISIVEDIPEAEPTAEVKYDYTSSRVYLANDAVGQFHPVCGNCEALVAKGWQYCTQCGARLIWGNV